MAYIDGANDITPLHAACNSKEMVKLLLDHGADVLAKDSEGHTPADWISWNDERDCDLIVSNDGPYIRERRAKQEGK